MTEQKVVPILVALLDEDTQEIQLNVVNGIEMIAKIVGIEFICSKFM